MSLSIIYDFFYRFVGPLGTIIIKCKDFRIIQLDIPGMEECLNIDSSIEVRVLETTCDKRRNFIFGFTVTLMFLF